MSFLDNNGVTALCGLIKEKLDEALATKQATLVSGTNIKTLNGDNLLGSGNISIKNTDTRAYQIRFNSCSLSASDRGYLDRLWLTSADGTKFVPINTSTYLNPSAGTALNSRPIDPFGPIVYLDAQCSANANLDADSTWLHQLVIITHSCAVTLTDDKPIYLKCTPQDDGSAIMEGIVQDLPTSNDSFIYIFLGIALTSLQMELLPTHPVYWHDGTGIRIWTGVKLPSASGVSF